MYASSPSREIAFVSNGAKGFEIGQRKVLHSSRTFEKSE